MSLETALVLGIDTGGTFTDAVLLDTAGGVVASAKARTNHAQLDEGIGAAIRACLAADVATQHRRARAVVSVAVSTTLATNAMVEGRGGPCGLVTIGFDANARSRIGGLRDDDVVIDIEGGHTSGGSERRPLDEAALLRQLDRLDSVPGVAVAGLFAVRNDHHEERVREIVRAETDLAVTCTHELSASLHGPKRAATALANARLIPAITGLVRALEAQCRDVGIAAPIMVVTSNGSVMAGSVAEERPVETILSGPAASIIGARHLAGVEDGVVVDIGGTTTDIALIRGGLPGLAHGGAVVGGVPTMVDAASVTTVGLGGDSRVAFSGRDSVLTIGPRRVEPICMASPRHPQIRVMLERQLDESIPREHDGVFFLDDAGQLHTAEQRYRSRQAARTTKADLDAGRLTMAALTPTDAAHVLGLQEGGDRVASQLAAELLARRLDRFGEAVAPSAEALCKQIIERVRTDSARAVARSAGAPASVIDHVLHQQPEWLHFSARLSVPIVGIGAGAGLYHRAMEDLLHTTVAVPDHADVANAVGAAVGSVRVEESTIVTQPESGQFRVHGPGEPSTYDDVESAVADATNRVRRAAMVRATRSGASAADVEVEIRRRDQVVTVAGTDLFVESRIVASVSGAVTPREGSG